MALMYGCKACIIVVGIICTILSVFLPYESPPFNAHETELPQDLSKALSAWPDCNLSKYTETLPNLTVITYVDGNRKYFYALNQSVSRAGWPLLTPGYGEPFVGMTSKLMPYLTALKTLEPCDPVLPIDGFDTAIYMPELLMDVFPAPGKVLVQEAPGMHHGNYFAHRWNQLIYGHRGDFDWQAGQMLGRAADVAKVLEVMQYVAIKYGMHSDQQALNSLRYTVGPAYQKFIEGMMQTDPWPMKFASQPESDWSKRVADPKPNHPALALHGVADAWMDDILQAMGLDPPDGKASSYDIEYAWKRNHDRVYKMTNQACGQGRIWCIQAYICLFGRTVLRDPHIQAIEYPLRKFLPSVR